MKIPLRIATLTATTQIIVHLEKDRFAQSKMDLMYSRCSTAHITCNARALTRKLEERNKQAS